METTQNQPSKRTRKPYRVVRVFDSHATHGIDPSLVLEIYPNGLIYIREHGRRTRRETSAAALYEHCIKRDVFKARMSKSRRR